MFLIIYLLQRYMNEMQHDRSLLLKAFYIQYMFTIHQGIKIMRINQILDIPD